jgi:hypothetical protein
MSLLAVLERYIDDIITKNNTFNIRQLSDEIYFYTENKIELSIDEIKLILVNTGKYYTIPSTDYMKLVIIPDEIKKLLKNNQHVKIVYNHNLIEHHFTIRQITKKYVYTTSQIEQYKKILLTDVIKFYDPYDI